MESDDSKKVQVDSKESLANSEKESQVDAPAESESQDQEPIVSKSPPRFGGLGRVRDQTGREKNAEIVDVVERIKPVFEEKTDAKYESLEVLSYKPQVVAGTNFFVKVRTKSVDGKEGIAHLRIYRNLKNEVELTSYQLEKKVEDELKHFN